jgi:hypothetical protein
MGSIIAFGLGSSSKVQSQALLTNGDRFFTPIEKAGYLESRSQALSKVGKTSDEVLCRHFNLTSRLSH